MKRHPERGSTEAAVRAVSAAAIRGAGSTGAALRARAVAAVLGSGRAVTAPRAVSVAAMQGAGWTAAAQRARAVAAAIGLSLALLFAGVPSMAEVPTAGASSGCGKAAATGVLTLSTQDGAARSRSFMIQVPSRYDASRPYPLIFVFHGAGGNAAESRGWGLQNATGASDNGIFVFPNGIAFQRYGIGWDDSRRGYDLPFFDNMLKALEAGYCIDKGKVFVAGFSWGGDFAVSLACNRGDDIQAVAANSTDDEFQDNTNYLTYTNLPCPAHRHPRIRFEHAVGGDSAYPAPNFATTDKLFRYLNACDATSTPVKSSTPTMACVAHGGCTAAYVECSFDHAIGHTLPPNWAEDTWAFFLSPAR